ncbi:hypothetical protein [Candidatus Halobonum tyrrellensis]|uniref:Uncharacterized protein n=1 Tax=Candidatus Halobonum tyrrellensis G22 TaxID=1324957 RepID=V4H7X4_9EURY|nr:hypothetical protein [Candidatus Halobonum tyrrellensis]ESP86790.1 hypothetical protein K933_16942 [Candidatus Halobonum tyrrellensis G22]
MFGKFVGRFAFVGFVSRNSSATQNERNARTYAYRWYRGAGFELAVATALLEVTSVLVAVQNVEVVKCGHTAFILEPSAPPGER